MTARFSIPDPHQRARYSFSLDIDLVGRGDTLHLLMRDGPHIIQEATLPIVVLFDLPQNVIELLADKIKQVEALHEAG